jgi:hypothetical protein
LERKSGAQERIALSDGVAIENSTEFPAFGKNVYLSRYPQMDGC